MDKQRISKPSPNGTEPVGSDDERAVQRAASTTNRSPTTAITESLLGSDDGEEFRYIDSNSCVFRRDKPGSAQDASPLYKDYGKGRVVLGVFDGMGGRGSEMISVPGRSDPLPNAYIASRYVKQETLRLLLHQQTIGLAFEEADRFAGVLSKHLFLKMSHLWGSMLEEGLRESSIFGGTMFSALPTTLSLAIVQPHPDYKDRVQVDTLNCGDSRIYILEPASAGGLAALTTDDVPPGGDAKTFDAFECLLQDLSLKEYVSADREAKITHRRFDLPSSSIIFACSDGFHHYHPTPLDLELLFLKPSEKEESQNQSGSRSIEDWFRCHIEGHFTESLNDDVTLAVYSPSASLPDFLETLANDASCSRRHEVVSLLRDWASGGVDNGESASPSILWRQSLRFAFERHLTVGKY